MNQLLFLGSGSAFTVGADNFHSNLLLISESGQKLLIDCGSDIRFSLYKAGFSHQDITDIYISHLHSDHVGGLEYIGLTTRFNPHCPKPNLYLSQDIADEIWEHTLSGGMRSIEGEMTDLNSFFNVFPVQPNGYFTWNHLKFNLVKVIHVNNGKFIMPTYGLFFEIKEIQVFMTTDTQFCYEYLEEYYEKADLIFHDCETSEYPTPVHTRYEQLLTLPIHIRNKIWLYGYQADPLPQAEQDGFLGFVKRGQIFCF